MDPQSDYFEKRAPSAEELRKIDQELIDLLLPVGDKILVRLVPNDGLKQTQAGLFLPQEYSAKTLDRAVLLALGDVSPENHFAAPIMARLRYFLTHESEKARLKDNKTPDVVEVFASRNRQDTHEYRYNDQAYLLVPCVFVVGVLLRPSPVDPGQNT